MKKIILITVLLFIFCTGKVNSQSLSINTDGSTANASAMLDVKSTVKGLLIPRMTRTERNAIASPATGLIIFQNAPDSVGLYYYTGSKWTLLFSNANSDSLAWRTGGNVATVDANNFIGTTDNIPFNIRVNNQKAGRIDNVTWNSFYGYQAANANTSGLHNTAIGYQALTANLSGTNNTAIGSRAAISNTTGNQNTAMGEGAMYLNTVGQNNTAVGVYAMFNNVAGSNGTAIGNQAMLYANNTTTPFTNFNVALGHEALRGSATAANNTGNFNTSLGYQTLWSNTTGSSNFAAGVTALYSNTTGGGNTAVGNGALYANVGADQNSAFGVNALQANTSGTLNTALGVNALYANTSASNNTSVGSGSQRYNVTGGNNTVVGNDAGFGVLNNSYSNNTIFGYQAGYGLTTGSNNVFLGYRAGYTESAGSNKLYIANSNASPPLIYGDFSAANVGLGTITPAEKLEITGNLKFTGASSIYSGTGTALTIRPGDGTGTGGALTIRGGNAGTTSGGAGGDLNLTGGANIPSGGAGYGGLGVPGVVNITGSYGYNSVGGNVNITAGATSCWSLVVGSHSDVNIKGGTNLATTAIASITVQGGYTIGSTCPTPNETGGNLIIQSGLGSGTGTNGNIQLLNGNVGIGCTAPAYKLHVIGDIASSGTVRTTNALVTGAISACSDVRYKKNITPLSNSLQKLMKMEGVNYYWKTSDFPAMNFNNKRQMGFIAQDVEKIFPEMVFTDDAGFKSIDYSRLTPVLVETIKIQQKQINELFKRVETLEKNKH